ncbi:unnamed protein product, partial [Callosobruchus maculatus]
HQWRPKNRRIVVGVLPRTSSTINGRWPASGTTLDGTFTRRQHLLLPSSSLAVPSAYKNRDRLANFVTVTTDPSSSIMNSFSVVLALALAALASAEPPSGYSYNRPSGGGGGGYSGGGGLSGGGGGYQAVSSGYQTSEGASVDPQLLEQVRQILLREEQSSSSSGGGGGGGGISSSYGAPSQQYGAPSPQYGVPSYQQRVVGIDLEGIKQAIQVAQYQQISQQAGGGGGYPSASYGAPSAPSGSYGAPY